jgi:hypothetical protein
MTTCICIIVIVSLNLFTDLVLFDNSMRLGWFCSNQLRHRRDWCWDGEGIRDEPGSLTTIRTCFIIVLYCICLLWLVLVFPFLHDEIVFPKWWIYRGKHLIFCPRQIDTRGRNCDSKATAFPECPICIIVCLRRNLSVSMSFHY